jgi:hypothetical protein
MYVCPKCGNMDVRETRQCPMFDCKPVCVRCCKECLYYDSDPRDPWACRFYINNPDRYHAPAEEKEALNYTESIRERIREKYGQD